MATDPEKLKRWTAFITKEIANRPNAKSNYVLLRAEQLVGTCLIMYMKNDIVKNVKHVEAATKKVRVKPCVSKGPASLMTDKFATISRLVSGAWLVIKELSPSA